jgi:CTP:molybdopterin cytidylyltransferase MocA
MGSPKALLPWGGRTLLASMVATAARAGLPPLAVVVGSERERVGAEAERCGATALWNARHRDGRFTSVRVAARWALGRAAAGSAAPALLLWPVDCPGVAAATLAALCEEAARHPGANVAPGFGGRGGHPVVLCAESVAEIAEAPDDADLRELVRRAPEGRRLLAVEDPAVLDDLDTPEDFARFLRERRPGEAA